MTRWHPLHVVGFGGRIRPPDPDETPLSPDECWIAIREGHTIFQPTRKETTRMETLNEAGPAGECWL